ncbi:MULTISPECIES: pentapeptide repeat-containing protein [unclassified Synechococcus]|uniref:pentapeptide repeat-containing protein n=1 Tax=unclassified Synechococcus TaxID=2626047 RepID=UPI001CF7F4E0|nr:MULTISPECIES: pentapeptide repeat-containing protein [unclassified Synechococcus]MCB4376666.1 pentapeptide repeat-containing protein [Synechococcus sp. MU1650]MCB4411231.1 pentapeptide repeat-containing protein [Synechococcus sp. MU1611]
MPARVLLFTLLLAAPLAARADDLIVLLQQRNCPDCHLADLDLVHADLRDADLQRAQLQRANLGQARLDGADLRKSNLQFTNLRGASLRGADLRGSTLYGTDLRHADLSGAQLDDGALEQTHWQGAQGIAKDVLSHASLHNAGVAAAEQSQWKRAEELFSSALAVAPSEPLSWVARGLCRGELGDNKRASQDLKYASQLFKNNGDLIKSKQLELASKNVDAPADESSHQGNGIGSVAISGTIKAFQTLAPLALRLISP